MGFVFIPAGNSPSCLVANMPRASKLATRHGTQDSRRTSHPTRSPPQYLSGFVLRQRRELRAPRLKHEFDVRLAHRAAGATPSAILELFKRQPVAMRHRFEFSERHVVTQAAIDH